MKYLNTIKNILFGFWASIAFVSTTHACNGWFTFSCNIDIPVVCGGSGCNLSNGVSTAGKSVNGLLTDINISVFAQNIVTYLLGFVSVIALVYIIYAGAQIMLGAGDEEKIKKAKGIVTYVIVGVCIMWLAYAIVKWMLGAIR